MAKEQYYSLLAPSPSLLLLPSKVFLWVVFVGFGAFFEKDIFCHSSLSLKFSATCSFAIRN